MKRWSVWDVVALVGCGLLSGSMVGWALLNVLPAPAAVTAEELIEEANPLNPWREIDQSHIEIWRNMATSLMARAYWVPDEPEKEEILFERWGLPEGYGMPQNVKGYNGETLATLWPDGHLELMAGEERIIRTMIDQRFEILKRVENVKLMLARELARNRRAPRALVPKAVVPPGKK